ncbi:MAG TPA: hypothetical protein VFW87_01400, partial [Pirellulales bacterium]|nr:hypothetical protein [Pirellulales bacterium]
GTMQEAQDERRQKRRLRKLAFSLDQVAFSSDPFGDNRQEALHCHRHPWDHVHREVPSSNSGSLT